MSEFILEFTPFQEGECDFYVKEATPHLSKTSGNKSIKLKLRVKDKNGITETVYCYLTSKMMKLLSHFCRATDLEDSWGKQQLKPSECVGKKGKCIVKMESSEGYPDRFAIDDFISQHTQKEESITPIVQEEKSGDFLGDDEKLPF
jgi:hypothetical protein